MCLLNQYFPKMKEKNRYISKDAKLRTSSRKLGRKASGKKIYRVHAKFNIRI